MGSETQNKFRKKKIDKRFLSKNKTIKLYKERQSKIDLFKKEVDELKQKYEKITTSENIETFDDIPLSIRTRKGLKECGYFTPTEIQKETILLGLKERDILGAAKTGSGKTLAFVIPLLEQLFVSGWTILDGLGALIITPTRELAYQIYEVINKVGANHTFSVGLIIGGKDLAKERKLLDKCNIMICTPGRLLQHMDENPLFDSMNLKILILDEADRILDLGFAKTLDAIIENLPQERQTLLFSATQTKSVKDLARLSLKNPVYVSVDEHAKYTTPEALQQSFIVCDAHDKMNLIWSFIKSHKKQKILVFMASCKQVKFTYESICRLRPGVSIMALYGSLHQLRRMQIYDEFCKKNHVVMFATDVASRGLDFPNVNWVVQLDCPEDVNTYIHRAGRTARYEKGGESLLVLLPSEKDSMIKQLADRKIPIEEIKANPNKLQDVRRKLDAILSRDKNFKESASRAFKSYLKNIYLMKDKSVFDVMKIDVDQYATSLGLNFVPRIRFLEKHVKGYKNASVKDSNTEIKQKNEDSSEDESLDIDSSIINEENAQKHLKAHKMPIRIINCDDEDSPDQDDYEYLIPMKQLEILSDVEEDWEEKSKTHKVLSKAALVKKALKKKTKLNTVLKYDEEGNPLREVGGQLIPDLAADPKLGLLEEDYSLDKVKPILDKENEIDRRIYKEKIKARHRAERLKKKENRWLKNPAGAPPTLKDSEDDSDKDNEDSMIDPNNMYSSESEEESSVNNERLKNHISSNDSSGDNTEESDRFAGSGAEMNINSEAESSEEELVDKIETFSGKRKKLISQAKSKKQKLNSSVAKVKREKQNRTLEDDEQLALHFLNS
ncbi:probable ATP-dependent RNA helicase DDX10 [Parasteatoda tepidariorum]|uniref:probable ATP-dependent RNA helicase DDX10 n=1 Tax=Parasteatoda tepidariorum TaxID=114398 RepID=UPI001C718075|nr:probable ATP-dependent RNA helicase DDX10 [Parasteatoda tepidariorum]